MTKNRFSRINQPVSCVSCGVRTTTRVRGSVGTDLCGTCYDAAGLENSHFDGHHEGTPHAGCKHCKAEAAGK